MLTYLEFINENKASSDLVGLLKTFTKLNDDYTLNFSNIGALVSYFPHKNIQPSEIDQQINEYKEKMSNAGYPMDKIKEIYKKNEELFLGDPQDYASDLGDVGDVWPYGGFSDILLYEASGGKFLLGGNDLTEYNDLLIKYNYGWHNHKYGILAIEQNFGTIDNFRKKMMTDAYSDYDIENVMSDHDRINEYYFTTLDKNAIYYYDNDLFYVYKIEDDYEDAVYHIISYHKGIVDDTSNFYTILREAKEVYSENGENHFIDWMKKHKWPDTLKNDEQLKVLFKSLGVMGKFNL